MMGSMFTEKFEGFFGEYRFLSNFYLSPIHFPLYGVEKFTSGEHLYQALKVLAVENESLRTEWVKQIAEANSPGVAKRLGQKVPLNRQKWDVMSVAMMTATVVAKFTQNLDLLKLLTETGDLELVEFNHWGDKFWGVDSETGEGQNHLGRILMNVRGTLTTSGTLF